MVDEGNAVLFPMENQLEDPAEDGVSFGWPLKEGLEDLYEEGLLDVTVESIELVLVFKVLF